MPWTREGAVQLLVLVLRWGKDQVPLAANTQTTHLRTRGGDGTRPQRQHSNMIQEKRGSNFWEGSKDARVFGGFPVWPKREDLQKWVTDFATPAFPEDLREQIETVNYPGKRLSLVVVVMKSVGSPKDNRALMFRAIKAFNNNKPTFQARGTEHTLWAGPSKPQRIRQEDNIVSEAFGIVKVLCKGRETELDHDYTKQRLFIGERLLASRAAGAPRLKSREGLLKTTLPGYKPELLTAARAEVQKAREEKRAKA